LRLHDLRHTWATLALEANVHPKVVQERIGHTSIAILYSHASRPMASAAAENVASMIWANRA
jgi:integrase